MPISGAVGDIEEIIAEPPEHHLILAGIKRLDEDQKKYGTNFPVDYYDQICRYLFQIALQENQGNKLRAFEDLMNLSDGNFGWDFQEHYAKLVGTDKKNGWDKVRHFAHSAYHRYTKGSLAAAVITRAKEFKDLVESWFGIDPEGWSDDDMIANYKGIIFAAEYGEWEQAFENFKESVKNFINDMGISMQQFLYRLNPMIQFPW
jgi:hypothetical protein